MVRLREIGNAEFGGDRDALRRPIAANELTELLLRAFETYAAVDSVKRR